MVIPIDQVHAGSYVLSAVLDRNKNFEATKRPDSGDQLAVDVPMTVAATGNTAFTASATYTVP